MKEYLITLVRTTPTPIHGRNVAREYLQELRLQDMERLDLDELQHQAELASSPKLRRAAAFVIKLARAERVYEPL
jgi:hypothetical protein